MIITNATAFINGSFVPNTSTQFKEGKIIAIGQDITAENEATLDLAGDYLLPGFVDVHIHAYMGQDTMSGEEAVRHMSRELKRHGVCAFLPTTMSASAEDIRFALAGIQAVMDSQEPDGAIVLGAHMEAPFLCASKAGAQVSSHFLEPTLENWKACVGDYASTVKLITLAPELPNALPFIEYLTSQGVVVSLGHTSATAEIVHEAADYGARHITHTFNAQTPLLHRAPGVPGASLVDDRYDCEVIADGIHLHPDVVKLILRCKGESQFIAITDAMEAAGMPEGQYQLGGQEVFVRNGAARLADNTLAGSTLTMIRALQNLIREFGATPEQAVKMTTCSPAKSVLNNNVGQIALGFPAIFARFTPEWDFVSVVG